MRERILIDTNLFQTTPKEMKRTNPKSHDSLFKWLITSFTTEFFAHYFPDVKLGQYSFIDKEFIRKYEALKESLKGDLFLLLEAEIDGELREIAGNCGSD